MPKISICIPTYNRSDLLSQTLFSVSRQTVKPFEVIVIDNCSEDDTEAVVKSFKENGVLYYRNEKNLGFVGNWNRCIELARGDFLTILHSDDMISPHWVEEWQKIISLYQDDQTVGAFFSHVFTVDINNNTLMVFKLFPLRPPQRLLKPVENFQELWKRNFCALPASGGLVLRKAVFAKLGKYQASYGTETDIALVLKLLNNYAVVFTSQYLYAYRIHSFQTFDREKMSKTFDKKFSVLQRNLDIFKDFYEKELCCGFKAPEFYKRVAFMYIAISFLYFLALKPRIAKKYFQLTLEKIPDLFNSMSDYYEAWSVFLHYLKVMLYGKLRAVFCYRAIAKDWGS